MVAGPKEKTEDLVGWSPDLKTNTEDLVGWSPDLKTKTEDLARRSDDLKTKTEDLAGWLEYLKTKSTPPPPPHACRCAAGAERPGMVRAGHSLTLRPPRWPSG